MPMQYPQNLALSTQREIAQVEGKPFDEKNSGNRTSLWNGKRNSSTSKMQFSEQ